MSKEDFVKIALENKLLDFGNVMSGEASRNQKKNSKYTTSYSTGQPGHEVRWREGREEEVRKREEEVRKREGREEVVRCLACK